MPIPIGVNIINITGIGYAAGYTKYEEVFGLGDDNNLYIWNKPMRKWYLHTTN